MKRSWQIFVAPGEENEPLPISVSPWHSERRASLPLEHWNLILDFIEQYDRKSAERLRMLSRAVDDNDDDFVNASPEDLSELSKRMEVWMKKIKQAPPLVEAVSEDIPDRYVNEEHARMLEAVAAVFREALRLEKPFRAWID
jgi:hypothetical protein